MLASPFFTWFRLTCSFAYHSPESPASKSNDQTFIPAHRTRVNTRKYMSSRGAGTMVNQWLRDPGLCIHKREKSRQQMA